MPPIVPANAYGRAFPMAEAPPQAAPAPPDPVADQKLKKAAGDFEAILLSSLWKSMKESFASPEQDDSTDPAKGTLDDWGIEIMSGAVGQAGGLGLGAMIVKQLEPDLRPTAGSAGAKPETPPKRSAGENGLPDVPEVF